MLSFYAAHVSALVTRNFAEFVVSISLENTPKIFIIVGIMAVGGYLASTNFKTIGRWSLIVLSIITFNLAITIFLSIPSMHISYLKPVMEHSIGDILSDGFSFGSIAFCETALALIAFGDIKKGESPYKAYGIGIAFGTVIMLSVFLRNCTMLGREMISTAVFPSYITAQLISPGSFIEHIESVVSFNLILLGITKIAICLRAASMGAAKLLRSDDFKKCIVPICLLSTAFCVTTFSNIQELIAFADAYRFYALVFAVLIPILIWIKSEWHKRHSARKSNINISGAAKN
jgi:spore germination protein KB